MEKHEYLDVFNDNMVRTGEATRQEVHDRGYWHQTFHCWIIRRDGDKRYVLFQRRGPQKSVYPNALDITAAGHLLAGETVEDGIREVNEELGLNARYTDLIPLGIRLDVAIIGPVINREFCHTYLYECNIPLRNYNLQPDEVNGLIQLELADGLALFSGQINRATVTGVQVDDGGVKHDIELSVTQEDFIPRQDQYYLKVFIMAERYFAGNRYLAI